LVTEIPYLTYMTWLVNRFSLIWSYCAQCTFQDYIEQKNTIYTV